MNSDKLLIIDKILCFTAGGIMEELPLTCATTEKVGHTTYTVTGSYEGKESFLKKLERIVAKNAQQKFEDEGADE